MPEPIFGACQKASDIQPVAQQYDQHHEADRNLQIRRMPGCPGQDGDARGQGGERGGGAQSKDTEPDQCGQCRSGPGEDQQYARCRGDTFTALETAIERQNMSEQGKQAHPGLLHRLKPNAGGQPDNQRAFTHIAEQGSQRQWPVTQPQHITGAGVA